MSRIEHCFNFNENAKRKLFELACPGSAKKVTMYLPNQNRERKGQAFWLPKGHQYVCKKWSL